MCVGVGVVGCIARLDQGRYSVMSVIIPALKATSSSTMAPSTTFIFLHGLGDTGNGWAPVMRMVQHALPTVKFILPHAPTMNVTLNNGLSMPAWYDIVSLSEDHGDSSEGISKSVHMVAGLIEGERRGGVERVLLGGFSQGGVIALACGLSMAGAQVDGIIALSSYLPKFIQFNSDRKDLPIFMGHGHEDRIVHYKWGQESANRIKSQGFRNVEFHSYSGLQHAASDQEIDDMIAFIRKLLYKQKDDKDEL